MIQKTWEDVLNLATERTSKPSYETWLKCTKLLSLSEAEQSATISSQNEFSRDWVESRYKGFLEDLLFKVTHTHYNISVISEDPFKEVTTQDDSSFSPINLDYTELRDTPIEHLTVENQEEISLQTTKELLINLLDEQRRTNELLEKLLTLTENGKNELKE